MSTELQRRAEEFRKRPIPKGLSYVPDSIAERFIAAYAANGKLEQDPDLAELLDLCIMETVGAVKSKSRAAAAYFRESTAILQAIQAELEG